MPRNRPHFLCIGAQKAATSWLAHNLRQHPEVWMPPIKEIHYFDRVQGQVPTEWAQAPGVGTRRHLAAFLIPRGTHVSSRAWRAVRLIHAHPAWASRFLLGRWTDRWYRSLFPRRPGLVTGEATPAYSRLDEDGVAYAASVAPYAKVVYLLRDPVERAWSGARMNARKRFGREIAEEPATEQIAFLADGADSLHPRFRRHSEYVANLGRWERHYPGERVHLAYYGDVVHRPADVLRDVYRFLGVSDDAAHLPPDVRRPVNRRAAPAAMPPETGRWLTEQLLGEVEACHARFQNAHTAGWLAAAERRLAA